MKTCTKCKETKSSSSFYNNLYAASGLSASCRACHLKVVQNPVNKANRLKCQRAWREKRKNEIYNLKTPCVACGESDPIVIDFHHTAPSAKSFNIANNGGGRPMKSIKHEITKCVCLCANCHRLLHAGAISLD